MEVHQYSRRTLNSGPLEERRYPRENKSDGYTSLPHRPPQQQNSVSRNPGLEDSEYAQHPVLYKLLKENSYNPREFRSRLKNARFFTIKSYSEDDVHRSIKYSIWCSTDFGNKRLDQAFCEPDLGPIYLFFSVNGSGSVCGMAEMTSRVDFRKVSKVWAQSKWKGEFKVKWIFVKDVPNIQFHGISLENNSNMPFTSSRDVQEVLLEKGKQVLEIIRSYNHKTSLFDDFVHYEKKEERDK